MSEAVVSPPREAAMSRRFYVWMSSVCLAVAVIGFAPTYWLQLPAGTFSGSPLIHLHAALFTAWPAYLLVQTVFAARGRLARHRAWGLFGIALATAMVFVGLAAASATLSTRLEAGYGDRARAFHIVSTSMMVLFGTCVFLAIRHVSRPEVHKRLMLLATIATLPPAVARVFFFFTVGMAPGLRPGLGMPRTPEDVLLSTLVADLPLVAGIVYDMRTRGRPHPVYVVGGAILIGVQLLRGPLSTTRWWHQTADLLARFAG